MKSQTTLTDQTNPGTSASCSRLCNGWPVNLFAGRSAAVGQPRSPVDSPNVLHVWAYLPSKIAVALGVLLFTFSVLGAIDKATLDWVEFRESRGLNVAGRNGEIGIFQIKRGAWQDVSKARAKRGLPWWDYAGAWDVELNRIYGAEYLEICRQRFVRKNRREPNRVELWATYRGAK